MFIITENFGADNTQTITAQFAQAISEAVTMADFTTEQSNFLQAINEVFVLLDTPSVSGWIKINDDQTITWTQINNDQSNGWTEINNSQ